MKHIRKNKGSALTEAGPALFILLVIIFFPVLDLLQLGAAYAITNAYHDHMIREIACRSPENQDQAKNKVNASFDTSGLFNFLKVQARTVDEVKYFDATGAELPNPTSLSQRSKIAKVMVKTSVTFLPFLQIPFFINVPGINAPVTFTSATERPQEEKGID